MVKSVSVVGFGANGRRRSREALLRKALFASTALVGVTLAAPAMAQSVNPAGGGTVSSPGATITGGGVGEGVAVQQSGNGGATVTGVNIANTGNTPTPDGLRVTGPGGQGVGISIATTSTIKSQNGDGVRLQGGNAENVGFGVAAGQTLNVTGINGLQITSTQGLFLPNTGTAGAIVATARTNGSGTGILVSTGGGFGGSWGNVTVTGFATGMGLTGAGVGSVVEGGSISATNTGISINSTANAILDLRAAITAPTGINVVTATGANVTTSGGGTINSTSAGTGTGISANSTSGAGSVVVTVGAAIGGTTPPQVGLIATTTGASTGSIALTANAAITATAVGIYASQVSSAAVGTTTINANVTGGSGLYSGLGTNNVTVASGATVTGTGDGGTFSFITVNGTSIPASNGYGVFDVNGAGTVTNSGTIRATGAGSTVGVYVSTSGQAVVNNATGTISGATGVVLQNQGMATNAGTITGAAGAGIRAFGLTSGSNNTGKITGNWGLYSSGNAVIFSNTGNGTTGGIITGTVDGINIFGGYGQITNTGLINTAGGANSAAGIYFNTQTASFTNTVLNSGTITGGNDAALGYGISSDAAATLIVTNQAGGNIGGGTGAIRLSGTGAATLDLQSGSSVNGTILSTNSGARTVTLGGALNGNYDGGSGTGNVTWTLGRLASMQGAVFGGGNDTFSYHGGAIAGVVDASNGSDSFTSDLDLATNASTLNIGNLTGFESYAHQRGILTLIGAGTTLWSLQGNTLNLGVDGTTTGSIITSGVALAPNAGTTFNVRTGSLIRSTGDVTIGNANGAFTINNAGTIDGTSGNTIQNGQTALTLNNTGTISTSNFVTVLAGTGSSITNSGAIIGGADSSFGFGVQLAGAGLVTNQTGGFINGLGTAGVRLENNGTVNNLAGAGITGPVGVSSAANFTLAVGNFGKIVGTTSGIVADGTANITNAGTIGTGVLAADGTFTPGGTGYGIQLLTGQVVNSGTVSSAAAAIWQTGTTGTLNLVNTGTLSQSANLGTDPADTIFASGAATIFNSGLINTPSYFAVQLTKGGTLTNAAGGTISGGSLSNNRYAVLITGGASLIDNYGTLTSTSTDMRRAIQTDGSPATINLYAGSTTGSIVTGAGNDTVTLYNGTGASFAGLLYNTTTGAITSGATPGANQVLLQAAGANGAATMLAGTSINLAGGANTVVLRGTGDGVSNGAGGVFSLTSAANLGTLTKMDSGTWFINGTGTGGLTQINAGTGGAPGSGGYLLFAATGLTSAINVNGATIRATVGGGFGIGAITATDPTIQYAASGTFTNNIMLASAAPTTDPTVLQTFGTGITATLTGLISQPGATAQPLIFSSIDTTGTQNTGTFVLTNGNNNYAGLTTISTGTTVAEQNTGFALGSGGVSINSDAVLRFDSTGGNYGVEAGTYSGAGTIRFTSATAGGGFFLGNNGIVNVALSSGGLIDVQSGYVQGSASSQGIYTNNRADLNIASGATFDGVEGTVLVDVLTGTGTLRGGFGSVRTTTIGVDNGSGTFSGTIANSGNPGSMLALVKTGQGTQTLVGHNTYTGGTQVLAGTLVAGTVLGSFASDSLGIGTVLISPAGTVRFDNPYTTAAPGPSNAQIYVSSNTFTGPGTLAFVGAAGSLTVLDRQSGTTNVAMDAGGLIDVRSGAVLARGTNVFAGNQASLNIAAGASFDGASAIVVDGLLGSGSYVGNGSLSVGVANRSTTFDGTIGNNTAGGAILALTKLGSGTQTLTGVNTYTGATTISGGTLSLSGAGSIANSVSVTNNANLSIVGRAGGTTVNQLTGTGTVMLGANTLTANNAASGTISGAITGTTGGFTKAGAGNLTLSGANSYTGTTTISAGTLTGTTASISGSSIVDNAALVYDQAVAGTASQPISGTGTINIVGAGAVTLDGSITTSNTLAVSGTGSALTLGGTRSGGSGDAGYGSGVVLSGTNSSLTVATTGQLQGGQFIGARLTGQGASVTNLGSITNVGTGGADQVGAGVAIYTVGGTNTVTNGSLINTTATISGQNNAINQRGSATTALTINNYGSLTAGNYSAFENSGLAGLLTVNNIGSAALIYGSAGGSAGLNVNSTSGATVVNSGRIVGNGNAIYSARAIDVTNTGLIGSGTISGGNYSVGGFSGIAANTGGIIRNNGGTIQGGTAAGIYSTSGALTVTNTGTISTAGTGTVDGITALGGPLTLTNTGVRDVNGVLTSGFITAATASGVAFTGAGSSITNSGAITGGANGAYGYGVQAGAGSAGSITNLAGGVLTGGTGGIVRNTTGAVTIDNNGVISGTGTTSYGINISAGTGTITNNAGGIIAGKTNGILSTVATTIINNGTIGTGTVSTGATPVFSAAGVGAGVQVTTGSITNSGTISGGNSAIVFSATTGSSIVTNNASGVIRATSPGGYGVNARNTLTLTNDGQIIAPTLAGNFTAAVFANGVNSAVTNNASGTIMGGRGIELDAGGTITNYGQVTGTVDNALTLFGGGTVTNDAGATLTATGDIGAWGIFAGRVISTNSVSTSSLINNGTINAGAGIVIASSNATITNTGAITAQDAGIWGTNGPAFTATNSGTITASVAGVRGAAGMVLTNTGSISGTTYGVDNAGAAATITNNGTISGGTFAIRSVGNFVDTVNLGATSTTSGGISLGAGDDTINLTLGANVTGTLDGGTGTNSLNIDGTGSGTIAGTITNFGNLTKNGTGTLTLSGPVDSSLITINAGTLALGASNIFADTATLTVNAMGTLDLGMNDDTVDTFNLYGTLLGGGTLTATNYNVYAGSTIGQGIGGGSLNVYGDSTLTSATAASPVNIYMGTLTTGSAERLSDTAAVNIASPGALTLGGAETIGSLSDLSGGGGTVNTGGFALTVGGNNASTTFSGTINGNGSLTKTGTGTLTLAGNNIYTGTTAINAGTLVATGLGPNEGGDAGQAFSALGQGGVSIASGATLQFDNQSDERRFVEGNTFTGAGTILFTGSAASSTEFGYGGNGNVNISLSRGGLIDVQGGTLVASTSNEGNFTDNMGDLNVGANGTFATAEAAARFNLLTGTGNVQISNAGSLTLGVGGLATDSATFAGVISAQGSQTLSGALIKDGLGTQTLVGHNTYTGGTQVLAGTLVAGTVIGSYASDALGIGSVAISSGATVRFDNPYTIAMPGPSGAQIYVSTNTFTGAGTLAFTGATGSLTVLDRQSGATNVAMAAGGLIDVQSGAVLARGTDVFAGNQANLNIASGASFDGASNIVVNGLTGGGTYVGNGTLSLGVANGSATFDGTIGNNTAGGAILALIKTGTATQTLTGVNSYTGSTTISGGTLALAGNGSIANTSVVNDATFDISGLTNGAASIVNLTGTTAAANVVLGGNALTLTNASGSYAGGVSGDGAFNITGLGDYTLSGALTNNGGIIVQDATNLTLTGSYTGASAVQINGGVFANLGSVTTGGEGMLAYGGSVINGSSTVTTAQIVGANSGIQVGGALTVDNYGLIEGRAYEGITNRSNGLLTVNNYATGVIYSQDSSRYPTGWAVGSDAGSAITIASNLGTIVGAYYGVYSTNAGDSITNSGTIASGTYTAPATPGAAFSTGTVAVGGIDAIFLGSGGSVTNSGTISGGDSGINLLASGSVANTGTITGAAANSVGVRGIGGGTITVVNAANASIAGDNGIYVNIGQQGQALTLVNVGSVTATNGVGIGGQGGSGLFAISNANGALIQGGAGQYGQGIQLNSATGSTVDNYGTILGGGDTPFAINSQDNDYTLNLYAGSTTGGIALGGGADTVSLYTGVIGAAAVTTIDPITGGTITLRAAGDYAATSVGAIDLGGGDNNLNLLGTGTGFNATGAAGMLNLSSIANASTITKAETGTWTLTGASASPAATINAGIGGTPGSGGLLVFDGTTGLTGAINVNGAVIRALTAGAFGTGTITTIDPTVQYGATGNYANNIVLAAADPANDPTILQTYGTGITATLDGAITEATAGQPLQFKSTDTNDVANAGTFILTNAGNSWTGVTSIAAGTTVQGTTATISGGSVVDNGTLAFVQPDSGTFALGVSGNGAITVSGLDVENALTLSGTLTNSGGIFVTDGSALTLTGADSSTATGVVLAGSGAMLNLTGSYTNSGGVAVAATGATATINNGGAGNTTALIRGSTAGITNTGLLTVSNYGTIQGDTAQGIGGGTLLLTNYAGGTITGATDGVRADVAGSSIANAGTIAASAAGGRGVYLTSGSLSNLSGGTISGNGTGAAIYLAGSGNTVGLAAGSTTNGLVDGSTTTGSNAYLIGGTLNGGLTAGAGTDTVTLLIGGSASGVIDGGAGIDSFVLDGSGTASFDSGNVINFENRVKNGLGTVTLTGIDSSTASWTINAGTLNASGGQAINDSVAVLVNANGTLGLLSNERIGSLSGTGAVSLGANTLFLGTNDASSTFSGVISGSGGLTQSGTGTLTLSGANTYTGTTLVSGGTFAFGASNVLADTSTLFVQNGTVNLGANSDTIDHFVLFGGTLNGTGTLTSTGASGFEGYTLANATINANLGTGSLGTGSGNVNTLLNGTVAASIVQSDVGTLTLGASNRLADTASVYVARGATLDLGAFTDTVGSLQLQGTLNGTGTLTATNYFLTAGVVNANLGTGAVFVNRDFFSGDTITTLNGTSAASTVQVNANATLALGASNRLADTAGVIVSSGGTLNIGAFNDTVGSLQLQGVLDGTGTLTASQYQLTGATVNANLGAGTLFNLGGTSVLNGTAAASAVNVNAGTLTLGASNRLADTATVAIASGATLNLGAFTDTVGLFQSSGTLAGTGTLTAGQYQLTGATVNANLGAGTLFNLGGTSVLNGTAAANAVNVNAGTLVLGASDRLADTATVAIASGATLNLGAFTDTVGLLQSSGTLAGTGTLTAAQYQLTGAAVNANLGAGTLFNLGGTSVLNGTAAASAVNVNAGTLVLGASDRLADTATVAIASGATLNIGAFTDTVGLLQSSGTLNGTGTLTAAQYQLTGATVNANLGAGTLFNLGGTSVLNGTAAASAVNINAGTLVLGASDRLADTATVAIASGATLNLGAFTDTVGLFQSSGTLNGTGTLTAAQYQLTGATVNANLGAGTLFNLGGTSVLNGTAAAAAVNVNAGTLVLGASDRLADTATVAIASGATLNLGAFNDTVGLLQSSGTLAGTGTLTAAQYQLTGATVNANLGAGTLFNLGGTSVLNGTAAASLVSINAGTLLLGANERLADTASVAVNAGATFDLGGKTETIGALFNGSNGGGTIALGAGTLLVGAANGDFGYSGAITGTGDVTKVGTGTFSLLGNLALTGRLNVNAGTLMFAGTTAGSVRVQGGTLTGSAAIAGNLALASGTLSPGTASQPIAAFQAGSLTVTGGTAAFDFSGSAGGFSADLLRVSGAATLSGGTVVTRATEATANYRVEQMYQLIGAAGVTGTFANGSSFTSVSNDSNLAWRLRYDLNPNAVILEVRKQIDYTAGLTGASGNQLAVGAALNGATLTASDAYVSVLDLIAQGTPAQRAATYDSIGGEALADVNTAVALAGTGFADLLRLRLRSDDGGQAGNATILGGLLGKEGTSEAVRAAAAVAPGLGVAGDGGDHRISGWLQAFGSSNKLSGLSGQASTLGTYVGVGGGLDARFGSLAVGIGVATNNVDTSVRTRTSRNAGNLKQAGGYVAYDDGALYGNVVGSYFEGDIDTTRSVFVNGGLFALARGVAPTSGYTVGGALGYRLPIGKTVKFTPQISYEMVDVKRDAFTETGAGVLSLAVAGQTRTLYSGTVEGRLSDTIRTGNGGTVTPYIGGGMRFNMGDLDATSLNRFSGAPVGSGAFTITGAKLSPRAALINGGIEAKPSERVSIGIGADAAFAKRQKDARVTMSIKIGF